MINLQSGGKISWNLLKGRTRLFCKDQLAADLLETAEQHPGLVSAYVPLRDLQNLWTFPLIGV